MVCLVLGTNHSGGESMEQIEKEYLNFHEVGKLLGINPQTVGVWRKKGFLPYLKIGKTVRFRKSDIVSHLRKFKKNDVTGTGND
jgi:excisionase family DNA binding protein